MAKPAKVAFKTSDVPLFFSRLQCNSWYIPQKLAKPSAFNPRLLKTWTTSSLHPRALDPRIMTRGSGGGVRVLRDLDGSKRL